MNQWGKNKSMGWKKMIHGMEKKLSGVRKLICWVEKGTYEVGK